MRRGVDRCNQEQGPSLTAIIPDACCVSDSSFFMACVPSQDAFIAAHAGIFSSSSRHATFEAINKELHDQKVNWKLQGKYSK